MMGASHEGRGMKEHSHNHTDYVPPKYRDRLSDDISKEVLRIIHEVEQGISSDPKPQFMKVKPTEVKHD